ncbi:MAG: penicillin acylase family protein [Actinobacteria bacterium]|nr:penicillin acylase family protein [Actinomycetota bacterium]MBU1945077.1 penicillin acylase family protein [Actinomycetota bacterium]MBU2688346.1 penicillin acylase family protein [Actinomycetota bacterium]
MTRRTGVTVQRVGLGVLGAAGCGLGYLGARLLLSRPRTSGRLRLPVLDSPAEVIFDGSGMPHIYAESDSDGFRALGYLMAQDRLVQMNLMSRLALGELSRVIGPAGLELDRFMRTMGLRGLAEGVVDSLEPESRRVLAAFGEGINSYISGNRLRLPFELMIMGGRPDPWTPLDCIAGYLYVIWLLDTWWTSDIMRENLIRALGPERACQLLPETADYNNPPCRVEGTGHCVETLEPGPEMDWGFATGPSGGEWLDGVVRASGVGSNNWVMGGSRTVSGKPILASDPHMQHQAPGLLYLFHLKTPGFDIAGAGFPGLPAVAFGHNGYCGWAETNLDADTIDLYVETFESEDSSRYRHEGEWEEAEVREEEIAVRFSRPRRLRVTVTRHGPVIRRRGDKGLALRWVSSETRLDTLHAMLAQCRARSWDEFVAPMETYQGPCSNQVYADVDGNIGYQAIGKVPVRRSGDGTIPCDGRRSDCGWEGTIPNERMPRTLNPEEGFLVTANSKAVCEEYPELISKEWNPPCRNARITELIREREKHAPADMARIQGDVLTHQGRGFARLAIAAAAFVEGMTPGAIEAIRRLESWDCMASVDSVEATICFYSWQHLREMVLRHRLGSRLYDEYVLNWTTVELAVENILEARDAFWLPHGSESFDEVVVNALEEGLRELESIFGTADQAAWRWGRVHHLTFRHPLGLFWPMNRIFNVGPVPIEGDASTVHPSPPGCDGVVQVHARGYAGGALDSPVFPGPDDYAAFGGPVLRMVLDFNDLDNSLIVLDMGQSGHRLSRHYKDHFPRWYRTEYFPFPYSRAAVEEQRESTLLLKP